MSYTHLFFLFAMWIFFVYIVDLKMIQNGDVVLAFLDCFFCVMQIYKIVKTVVCYRVTTIKQRDRIYLTMPQV